MRKGKIVTKQEKEIIKKWLEERLDIATRKENKYRYTGGEKDKQLADYWASNYVIVDSLLGSLSTERERVRK